MVAWQRLVCRVLLYLTFVAAMRPNRCQPGPLTLLSTARSPSQPCYQELLVGSYPTLSPITLFRAGLLSVAVVVKGTFQRSALTYCFVRQSCFELFILEAKSQEVPLPNPFS